MLTEAQLRLLAARRVARGEQLAREHVRDGVGCCRRCGREYPCDGRRLGLALVGYYQHFTATATVTATGDGPAGPHATPTPASLGLPATPPDSAPSNRLYLVRAARVRLAHWLVRHAPR